MWDDTIATVQIGSKINQLQCNKLYLRNVFHSLKSAAFPIPVQVKFLGFCIWSSCVSGRHDAIATGRPETQLDKAQSSELTPIEFSQLNQ